VNEDTRHIKVTLIATTPHNSAPHNTTLHTNFLLQDRQL